MEAEVAVEVEVEADVGARAIDEDTFANLVLEAAGLEEIAGREGAAYEGPEVLRAGSECDVSEKLAEAYALAGSRYEVGACRVAVIQAAGPEAGCFMANASEAVVFKAVDALEAGALEAGVFEGVALQAATRDGAGKATGTDGPGSG